MDRSSGAVDQARAVLEPGVAALAGFLAGLALRGQWPLLERVIALLTGP